jgi:hypothetical protein
VTQFPDGGIDHTYRLSGKKQSRRSDWGIRLFEFSPLYLVSAAVNQINGAVRPDLT